MAFNRYGVVICGWSILLVMGGNTFRKPPMEAITPAHEPNAAKPSTDLNEHTEAREDEGVHATNYYYAHYYYSTHHCEGNYCYGGVPTTCCGTECCYGTSYCSYSYYGYTTCDYSYFDDDDDDYYQYTCSGSPCYSGYPTACCGTECCYGTSYCSYSYYGYSTCDYNYFDDDDDDYYQYSCSGNTCYGGYPSGCCGTECCYGTAYCSSYSYYGYSYCDYYHDDDDNGSGTAAHVGTVVGSCVGAAVAVGILSFFIRWVMIQRNLKFKQLISVEMAQAMASVVPVPSSLRTPAPSPHKIAPFTPHMEMVAMSTPQPQSAPVFFVQQPVPVVPTPVIVAPAIAGGGGGDFTLAQQQLAQQQALLQQQINELQRQLQQHKTN